LNDRFWLGGREKEREDEQATLACCYIPNKIKTDPQNKGASAFISANGYNRDYAGGAIED